MTDPNKEKLSEILDELILHEGLTSNEIVKKAFAIMIFLTRKKKEGYKILIQKDNDIQEVKF